MVSKLASLHDGVAALLDEAAASTAVVARIYGCTHSHPTTRFGHSSNHSYVSFGHSSIHSFKHTFGLIPPFIHTSHLVIRPFIPSPHR